MAPTFSADWYGRWQRSLEGYSPWGHKESDMTKWQTHTRKAGDILWPQLKGSVRCTLNLLKESLVWLNTLTFDLQDIFAKCILTASAFSLEHDFPTMNSFIFISFAIWKGWFFKIIRSCFVLPSCYCSPLPCFINDRNKSGGTFYTFYGNLLSYRS